MHVFVHAVVKTQIRTSVPVVPLQLSQARTDSAAVHPPAGQSFTQNNK